MVVSKVVCGIIGADIKGTIWKTLLKGLIGLIVIGAAVLVWQFIAFDTCLDRGGRWIYEEWRCEFCFDAEGNYTPGRNCEQEIQHGSDSG